MLKSIAHISCYTSTQYNIQIWTAYMRNRYFSLEAILAHCAPLPPFVKEIIKFWYPYPMASINVIEGFVVGGVHRSFDNALQIYMYQTRYFVKEWFSHYPLYYSVQKYLQTMLAHRTDWRLASRWGLWGLGLRNLLSDKCSIGFKLMRCTLLKSKHDKVVSLSTPTYSYSLVDDSLLIKKHSIVFTLMQWRVQFTN